MNRPSKILGAMTLLSLLAVQASGLHLHVDETGRNAGLHAAHTHHAHRDDHQDHNYRESQSHWGDLHAHASGNHDHTQEADVSLFEELNSSPYSDQVVTTADQLPGVPVPIWHCVHSREFADTLRYTSSSIYWRPPLRAPPLHS